jgi:hypothetical protein
MDNTPDPKLQRAEYLMNKAPDLTAAEMLEVKAMLDMRPTLNKKEAQNLLGIQHSKMGELLKDGEFPSKYYQFGRLQLLTHEVWAYKIKQAQKGQRR